MSNPNAAPKVATIFFGAGFLLAACSGGEGGAKPADSSPVVTASPAVVAGPSSSEVPPKGASQSPECTGAISGMRYVTFGKEGESWEITAIEGGSCAAIYNNNERNHTVLGSVSIGTVVIPCRMGEGEASYLRVFTSDAWLNSQRRSGTDYVGNVLATSEIVAAQKPCDAGAPVNGFTQPA